MKIAYNILFGKPEGSRPFERPRYRWEDITLGFRETGWESVNWIYVAQSRYQWRALVNTVMNRQVS
jgi:hypothetical protein